MDATVFNNITKELKDNAMLKHSPQLFDEWDFEKNKAIDIYSVTKSSAKKVWWICPDCNSEYDMPVEKRTTRKQNCPYCSGVRVNHTNSLASLNPNLASQWHPTKNGKLTPHDKTRSSHLKVWWLGSCGHE